MINNNVIKAAKLLLERLLTSQEEEGHLLGSDIYTYHLIEALRTTNARAFEIYIERALNWFEDLKDPRDKNSRSLSPFRLMALIGTDRVPEYQRVALGKVVNEMVGQDGNINFPLGFVEASDTYDGFPTIAAAFTMLRSERSDLHIHVCKGLRWAHDHLADIRRPGTVGFLALALAQALDAGLELDESLLKNALDELKTARATAEIEGDPFQASYVAFDLSSISVTHPQFASRADAIAIVEQTIGKLDADEEGFYEGQERVLLDLRLLAACGAVMTNEQREAFVEELLATAFSEKVTLRKEYQRLHSQSQDLLKRYRALEAVHEKEGLLVQPYWRIENSAVDPKLVFFLMPLPKDDAPEELKIMERMFQGSLKTEIEDKLGLEVRRADLIFDTRDIMLSIWDSILCAGVIVADLTQKNPNVFYEVGVADTLGKEVVLLAQDIEDVPFDLRQRRIILYSTTYPGPDKLRTELLRTLENVVDANTGTE